MKRIGYDGYGGPDVMYLQNFTPAVPGPHEVTVSTRAASFNPIDWKLRYGAMRHITGEHFPRSMGSDFAGIVTQIGSEVTEFKLGDEVVGSTTFEMGGAFAQAVTTSDAMLAKKPAAISFNDATAVALVGITAWLALVQTADLQPGQHVLINGALGGVGQAAVTLANSLGAITTGRVSPDDLEEAGALGLQSALDYTQPLGESLKGSFDVIFDVNGSLTTDTSVTADTESFLKAGGLLLDINPTETKFAQASPSHKFVFCEGSRQNLETALALAVEGKLRTAIGQTRSFEQSIELITALENGQRVSGKSVIEFS